MNYLVILFFLCLSVPFAQGIPGKVTDAETGAPLANAILMVEENDFGTTTDDKGIFNLPLNCIQKTVVVKYLGYRAKNILIMDAGFLFIRLEPSPIMSQSVLVEASIGREGVTPAPFTKINKEEIENKYSVQDIPAFLSSLPSTMFYSESGNGIGYNYLTIRGFDQRRITVSINGIPQNDPEDHNVYWLDFPDLLESTQLIQVQRGAGGISGYPSIGGSINIITSGFTPKPQLKLNTAYGSYHTRKYSASFSSGLIDGEYSVYGNLSQILSSGYRNKSWVKFNSYHLSAVKYNKNLTTQFNFYGGPISDGLAYTGLAKFAIKDKDLRRANYSYWEAEGSQYTYTLDRRPEEKENFSQPHFELLNDWVSDNINLNSAIFLVLGNGFFDYDASWADTSYFRMTSENGFTAAVNPGNALIRAMVENTQYGWIPRFSLKHTNGELIAGSEIRIHKSVHWGSILFAENLPAGISPGYKYYSYRGAKNIINGFINERYNLTQKMDVIAELQMAYHKYRLYDEEFVGTDFSVDGLFINPKAAVNYRFYDKLNTFFSYARVTREPRLKNYYDAAESSGGESPMFEQASDGNYNFKKPLVKPETMNDFEVGTLYNSGNLSLAVNLYYMQFEDEIVKNGKLDRFGQPVTGNMKKTIHQGVEGTVHLKLLNDLNCFANATYSRNTIEEGFYFIDADNSIDLEGNRISGFPDFLASAGINYKLKGLRMQITGKYTGKFYSDNYDENLSSYLAAYPEFVEYSDNLNEAYLTLDLSLSYETKLFNADTPSKLFMQIFNVTDNLYSAYAIGKEFFPAAERNFIIGLQLGL